MIVLIDADSLVYSCCWGVESKEEAFSKFDEHIHFIVNEIAEQYDVKAVKIFHGQEGTNFRKKIDETYKANRRKKKPDFYYDLSKYVKTVYEAISAKGEEVDDLVASTWRVYHLSGKDACIVTIDKDYKQIPNVLIFDYSEKRRGFHHITPQEAQHNFFTQMLVGDSGDNVKGVPGVGPVIAGRILEDAKSRIDYWRRVISTYKEKYPENGLEKAREAYKLLKIG